MALIFNEAELAIAKNASRAKYTPGAINKNIHWGQRKLLLSEIEFFTFHWDPATVPNPVCVYVGAAHGDHIPLLSRMFPEIIFHLYDPSPFSILPSERIKIFSQYFTSADAGNYAGRDDIFFISDIRRSSYDNFFKKEIARRGITIDKNGKPVAEDYLLEEIRRTVEKMNEQSIAEDMAMQQAWVLTIDPVEALLKFRLPYSIDGQEMKVSYLQGLVYWQVWEGKNSTETRLKPIRDKSGKYVIGDWYILEYEEWCCHHNSIVRSNNTYQNFFTNDDQPFAYPELLSDYDSVGEAFIIKSFLQKRIVEVDSNELVASIATLITSELCKRRKTANSLAARRTELRTVSDQFRKKRWEVPSQRPPVIIAKTEKTLPAIIKISSPQSPEIVIVEGTIWNNQEEDPPTLLQITSPAFDSPSRSPISPSFNSPSEHSAEIQEVFDSPSRSPISPVFDSPSRSPISLSFDSPSEHSTEIQEVFDSPSRSPINPIFDSPSRSPISPVFDSSPEYPSDLQEKSSPSRSPFFSPAVAPPIAATEDGTGETFTSPSEEITASKTPASTSRLPRAKAKAKKAKPVLDLSGIVLLEPTKPARKSRSKK